MSKLLLLLIALISCAAYSSQTDIDQTGKSAAQATPTTWGFSTYTNTLISPNQEQSVLIRCFHYAGDIPHCNAVFPNGKESELGEGFKWLPDNRHLVTTNGCNHDSPCEGSNLWNAIEGEEVSSFYLWYQVSPDQKTLVYLKKRMVLHNGQNEEETHLTSMDLSTELETELTSCPVWLQAPYWAKTICD